MYFKLGEFIPAATKVAVYAYEICDAEGNVLSSPTFEYLNWLHAVSSVDAKIITSHLKDMATKFGILGRKEFSIGREALYALPAKYDEVDGKILSRYRLYFWILNESTILVGGGCYKPETVNEIVIKSYQQIPNCEKYASELASIGNRLEFLIKKGGAFIDTRLIETDEEIIKI